MVNQMVSRFRVKKLSPKHPLPVYKEYQLPDLSDATNIQRAVPQIETGVEKEEEEEHDLQAAISAAQAAVTTGANVEKYIPIPDASRRIPDEEYTALYKKNHKDPSTLIRFSSTVEDSIGCPYLMDEEDDSFLEDYNKQHPREILSEDSFESIMWELESITNQQWPHLALDPQIPEYKVFLGHIPSYSKLKNVPNLSIIYNHWSRRRQKREGKSVIPSLKSEEAYKNEMDPYVCFRKRETKPGRKTRRSDQQSLERLRNLRLEMEMARNLLERVLRREKIRKECLVIEHAVFEKRCALYEYQRILGIREDEDLLLPKKKQRTSLEGSGATIKIPVHKLKNNIRFDKSPTQIAIEAELSRKREADALYEDVTELGYQPFAPTTPQLFYQPLSVSGKTKPIGPRFRKRMGRNGRLFIDRISFSSKLSDSGKTKPGSLLYDPSRFDSDVSDNEDNEIEIDEMGSLFLKHRAQLLTETELRNLVTIPFLTPNNIMSMNQVRHAVAAFGSSDNRLSQTFANQQQQPKQQSNNLMSGATIPIKRQNSGRTKMTPQQASLAMASGMIAANMTAAVHNPSNTGKTAIQMAMAAAQHQQQLNSANKANLTANPSLYLHL